MSFSRKTFIDIFGEVSPNFKIYTLEDIASNEKRSIISGPFGSNISSKYFKDEGIPVIRGNNLTEDDTKFIDDGFVFVSKEKADELNTYAKVNDLIFTAAGTIGQVGMIPKDSKFNKYIISNKQLRVTLDLNKVNHFYVYYWFSSKLINKYIKQLNTGSTIPLINLSIIKGLPIPLPNKDIQDKIVSIIDSIDQKIENCQNINKNLEELSTGLAINIFKKNDKETIELKEICKFIKGRKPKEISEIKENNFLNYLTIDVLTNQNNSYAFDEKGIKANEYDILMVMDGASSGKLFYGKNGLVGSTLAKLETDKKYQEIVYQFLKINEPFICENTTGTAIPHTDKGLVLNLQCPLSADILKFSEIFKTIRSSIISNTNEIAELQKLRDTLLPKLMSGDIDVSEVNCDLD